MGHRKLSTGTRVFVTVGLCVVLVTGSAVGLAAASILRAGSVTVAVDERDGASVSIACPAILLRAALAFVPDEALRPAAEEAGPWIPAARAAWRKLAECPDAVLVHVESRGERVTVEKRGNNVIVEVLDGEDRVHLSVPIWTVTAVLERIEAVRDV